MKTPPSLLIDRGSEGIVTLCFHRPEVLNALDWEAMEAFAAAVEALHQDCAGAAGPRLVILAGAGGRAFSAGGDQAVLHRDLEEADGERLATLMGGALRRLEALPIPSIAAVDGFALGGGSEIALACDLRVVDEAARFGLVHGRLGLIPGWGAGQRLLRLLGPARAMDLLLSGRQLGAQELLDLGLAGRRAPAGQALSAARAWAQEILRLDDGVIRAVKGLLAAGRELPYDQALALEASCFPVLWAAPAHRQAVAAFLGRRGGQESASGPPAGR